MGINPRLEQIVIRRYTPQDTLMVYNYFQSLSEATKSIMIGFPFTMDEAIRETGEELEGQSTRRFLVSTPNSSANGEIMIGMVWFWGWERKIPWFGICICDDFQEKGLGGIMMEFAIQEAKAFQKGGILLTTAKNNIRGQALYKRHGYTTLGDSSNPPGEYIMILNFPDEAILAD